MSESNEAAWLKKARGNINVEQAPFPVPGDDEIVIEVCPLSLAAKDRISANVNRIIA